MKELSIGVLGGMGTYATIHLFQQYAEVFEAEKEWDRPRIVIDNRCTMPSRVRAFLYGEKEEELVNEMDESMRYLAKAGCNRIILACNTSHIFLPKIYDKSPELEGKVVNIINACVEKIESSNVKSVYLLGSEGTIESNIYQNAFEEKGIECIAPIKEEYDKIRECIEAVKQNRYSTKVENIFMELLNRHETCILGCTELPILYEKYSNKNVKTLVFDPLLIGLERIKREYDE